MSVKRWLPVAAAFLAILSLAPFILIARMRAVKTARTPVHVFFDMDFQPKFKGQASSALFRDRRAMRPPVAGAVARGELRADDHLYLGQIAGQWAETFPIPIDAAAIEHGRQRFDIFCATCHGLAGYGDGIIDKRAQTLREGAWTPPLSFHSDVIRQRPVGRLFNTISNGVRSMPAYGPQIPVADRWAIVAYVRALQRSQNSRFADAPPDMQAALRSAGAEP